jgi:hypothetical protein
MGKPIEFIYASDDAIVHFMTLYTYSLLETGQFILSAARMIAHEHLPI